MTKDPQSPRAKQRIKLEEKVAATQGAERAQALLELSEALVLENRLEDALAALGAALDLTPESRTDAIATLKRKQAAVLSWLNRFEEALELCREARRLYSHLGNGVAESMCLNHEGALLVDLDRFELGVGAIQVAAENLQELSHPDLAAECRQALAECWMKRDPKKALGHFEVARSSLLELGETEGAASCDSQIARILMMEGQLEDAEEHLDSARQAFAACGNDLREAVTEVDMAVLNRMRGRDEEALDLLKHARGVVARKGTPEAVALCATYMGDVLQDLGRYEEAVREYQRARRLTWRAGDQHEAAVLDTRAGRALQALGNYGEALRRQRRARKVFRELGSSLEAAISERFMAVALERLGKPEEALELLEGAREALAALDETAAAWLDVDSISILVALGREDEAFDRFFAAKKAIGDEFETLEDRALLARQEAVLYRAEGEVEAALDRLGEALRYSVKPGDLAEIAALQKELQAEDSLGVEEAQAGR